MRRSDVIEIPRFLAESRKPVPGELLRLPNDLRIALRLVSGSGGSLYIENVDLENLRERFRAHPDSKVVKQWLKKSGSPYGIGVAFWLCAAVLSEWAIRPKTSAAQHRRLYGRIAGIAQELAELTDETGMPYVRGEHFGLARPRVFDLLTQAERRSFSDQLGRLDSDDVNRSRRLAYALPTLTDLLIRLASESRLIAKAGSLHRQPRKSGAERGFFVRRINELCALTGRDASAEVIAALTTIALCNTTDRDLVAKILKR